MRCPHCQSDLPETAAESLDQRCPVCGKELETAAAFTVPDDVSQIESQLAEIRKLLETAEAAPATVGLVAVSAPRETRRVDSAHGVGSWHAAHTGRAARPAQTGGPLETFAWGVLSLGIMAFVCGGVLLGWSLYTVQDELWRVGLPIALAGQVVLVLGVVLLLERIWHEHRAAAGRLDRIHRRLDRLHTANEVLRQSAAAFTHAPAPALLFTELKTRLERIETYLEAARPDRAKAG